MTRQSDSRSLICSTRSDCNQCQQNGVASVIPPIQISKIIDEIDLSVVITNHTGSIIYENIYATQHRLPKQNYGIGQVEPLLDPAIIGKKNRTTILTSLQKLKRWQFDQKIPVDNRLTIWQRVVMTAIFDVNDVLCHIVILRYDITNERSSLEQLLYSTRHDRLTKLVNKDYFIEQTQKELADTIDQMTHLAVLILDIDSFHVINEAHGYAIGDQLLRDIAARLTAELLDTRLVGRLSGDKFIILYNNVTELNKIFDCIESIQRIFNRKFEFADRSILVSVCIGAALNSGTSDAIQLLRDADSAMHHAKADGKNNYAIFNEQLEHAVLRTSQIEVALRSAIEKNELSVYFQPIVDSSTGVIACAEALIRWHNPVLGHISPAEFIPIAEQSGQIVKVGTWVLEQVCQQVAAWRKLRSNIYACVNVSAVQLIEHYQFYHTFETLINQYGLVTADLELEVTESLMLDHDERHAETLKQLVSARCRFAIDDFGTGFSSLRTLSKFEFHKLKIDKSFVQNVSNSSRDRAVTEAIAQIAKTLDMQITAEGVETAEMLTFCQSLGCDFIQGYLFYKPMPAAELLAKIGQPHHNSQS